MLPRLILLALCASASCSTAAELPDFAVTREVLDEYCFRCHNDKKAKGAVNLERFVNAEQAVGEYRLWERVREQLQFHAMPPEGKDQPAEIDRKLVVDWVSKMLEVATHANAGDPGTVVMRRLTNAEYDFAIRDLTGHDYGLAKAFPGDGGGGEGFSNTGSVLFVSPEHLEKYVAAARRISQHAMVMPGTGVRFFAGEIGPRGPAQMRANTETDVRALYTKLAAPLIPADVESQRIEDYLRACWRYRHRDVLGEATLPEIAAKRGLNKHFLANWWRYLNSTHPKSRYLDFDRLGFAGLPAPTTGKSPEGLEAAITFLANQRRSWYKTQRQQQDVNAQKPYRRSARVAGKRIAYLVVTDTGDGNAGDRVNWQDLKVRHKDGRQLPFGKYAQEYRKSLIDKLADDPENEKLQQERQELDALLAARGRKWDGSHDPKDYSLYVAAPSVVEVPLNGDVVELSATAQVDWDKPDGNETSLQAEVLAAAPAEPLPPILAGKLVLWNRLSAAKDRFWKEYGSLRVIFPDTHDRRLLELQKNYVDPDKPGNGVYYLSHEQLLESVTDWDALMLDRMQTDWQFVSAHVRHQLHQFNQKHGLKGDERDAQTMATLPEKEQKHYARLQKAYGDLLTTADEQVLPHLYWFAYRAWRRELTAAESADLASLYHKFRKAGQSLEEAGRLIIVRILSSPKFLYRGERASDKQGEHPVSSAELASRLSFFLWASTPDHPLQQADLRTPQERRQQVLRMLKDRRARALATEFAGQWLQIHDFPRYQGVDRERFPSFTDELRRHMHEETVRFVADLFRNDRSLRELFWGKHTFLNETLARHYGIAGVTGSEFRRVEVAKQHRGGLLGMGAILTKTSYPLRTSPVVRGHWLLDTVLGAHVPPPPDNVPPLEDAEVPGDDVSVRKRLEIHRDKPACAGCHNRIDPLGFALENFDPVGRWRAVTEGGKALDVVAEVEGHAPFEGPGGLRQYLQSQEDKVLGNFCGKLLGYALGRELLLTDRPLLERMLQSLKENDYRPSVAVLAIVESRQFLNRINEAGDSAQP